jgi:hypothetical protein
LKLDLQAENGAAPIFCTDEISEFLWLEECALETPASSTEEVTFLD